MYAVVTDNAKISSAGGAQRVRDRAAGRREFGASGIQDFTAKVQEGAELKNAGAGGRPVRGSWSKAESPRQG